MRIIGFILFAITFFVSGFVASYFIFRPGELTADFGELVLERLRQAQTLGNNIINCRSIVSGSGRLKLTAKAGSWESILPAFKEEGLAALPSNPANVIIFAHGYNSNLDGALKFGNAICEEIHSAAKTFQDKNSRELVFYTFCWRGDFNQERFGTSEISAEATAPSLANIISAIEDKAAKENKNVSVTLLSHSLGAKVCLETLKVLWHRDKNRKWIKNLVMLQPAVTVGSVSKGTYLYLQIVPQHSPAPGEAHVQPVQIQAGPLPGNPQFSSIIQLQNDGKYFDSCLAAENVWATVSSNDSVLKNAFSLYSHSYDFRRQYVYAPDIYEALGSSNISLPDAKTGGLVFPRNFKALDFSPGTGLVSIKEHSDITANQRLIDFWWEKISKTANN